MPENKIKTIYIEPSSKQIQNYALNVCKTLKSNSANKYFYQQEFIGGLTSFMKYSIKIQTKYVNREQEKPDVA